MKFKKTCFHNTNIDLHQFYFVMGHFSFYVKITHIPPKTFYRNSTLKKKNHVITQIKNK